MVVCSYLGSLSSLICMYHTPGTSVSRSGFSFVGILCGSQPLLLFLGSSRPSLTSIAPGKI